MDCPKCKTFTLQCVTSSQGGPIKCSNCGGFWIHADQIPKFMTQESVLSQIGRHSDKTTHIDSVTGLCPLGHGILSRVKITSNDPFYLDRCSRCGGIWFDRGEWHKLATAHLLDNIADFWTTSWQNKQRESAHRDAYIHWAQQEFGNELFDKLYLIAKQLKSHPSRVEALAFIKNISE
ncbi:MAG: zf-TFIIB domain-containing protein [Pedobacter sp.]